MAQTIQEALRKASFFSDEKLYKLVRLPSNAITVAAGIVAEMGEPFSALIVDKDEVSLMIDEEALNDFSRRLLGHQAGAASYRLITIDVELEPTLIGFMARISAELAEAGVPIFPYAAYTRDHLFVPAEHQQTALDTLNRLQSSI